MTRRHGWTLIELLYYMVLASVLVGVVYMTFSRSYRIYLTQERALDEVRSSIDLIAPSSSNSSSTEKNNLG